jgi:carboxyl-terminal processing protease
MKLRNYTVLALLVAFTAARCTAESYTNAYEAIALFTKVLEEVRRSYVEPAEAGYDALIRHALTGMLQNLDPYSQFMDERAYENLKDDTSGHFSGVGLVVSMKDGLLTVVAPMEGTPAFRAGLLPGDVILEIDGEETRTLALSEAVKRMRGESGTEITLRAIRPSSQEVKEHVILREEITVASVKEAGLLEDGIGYIRVTQFNEPTAGDLKAELKKLIDQDLRALILDLRGNPGGLLTAAAGVAELFLPRGSLIVYTQGREEDQRARQQFKSSGSTHYTGFPMVILVNGGSASASEIVAGALQDHKRAVLIGEKTFGKGSVQSILPLSDGAAVKLTTAKYYTPSARMIHEKGLEPDIAAVMNPEDLYKIRLRQMLKNGAAAPQNQEPELRDLQLDKAISVLQGVLLFNPQP